jgi:hypothetical protein
MSSYGVGRLVFVSKDLSDSPILTNRWLSDDVGKTEHSGRPAGSTDPDEREDRQTAG